MQIRKLDPVKALSVIKKENGRNGQAVKNKNNSYDYGVM